MTTTPSLAVNLIVSASNLAGLPALLAANTTADKLVSLLVMLASIFMHLSERKHNLNGIAPLNRWSREFELVDKSMAWIAGLYFVSQNPQLILQNYPLVIFGLIMVGLAERYEGGYLFFTITHVLWHFSVYRMIYLFVQARN